MVAAFLEVHHHVQKGHSLGTTGVQLLKVLGQDPAIILPENHTHQRVTRTSGMCTGLTSAVD